MVSKVKLNILPQPTETSCGPTCLHAVYSYFGLDIPLDRVIDEVPSLEEGGTLAVYLGLHARKKGFKVTIYTYNLRVFDPCWFFPKPLSPDLLIDKLNRRAEARKERKLKVACNAYARLIEKGGEIKMHDLNGALIRSYLKRGIPLLTGLSSTYLYLATRNCVEKSAIIPDDVAGDPEGHFVILENYNIEERTVTIIDPYGRNPYSKKLRYTIGLDHLINAILLGVLTYDANLLILEK